jgi:hypothetical protein
VILSPEPPEGRNKMAFCESETLAQVGWIYKLRVLKIYADGSVLIGTRSRK